MGQVTLPAEVRTRLGIKAGGVMILEEVDGALVLHPAAVVPVETYSAKQIARWDEDDRLGDTERAEIMGASASTRELGRRSPQASLP